MIDTAQLVRVQATYQWFGDGEPWVWMTGILDTAKSQGRIASYEVVSAKPPLSVTDELMAIEFVVDMNLPNKSPRRDETRYIIGVLNEIVGDTDVEIHTITPISQGAS